MFPHCDFCLSGLRRQREAPVKDQNVRLTTLVRIMDVSSIDWTGGSKIEL